MSQEFLTEDVKFTKLVDATAAGVTTITTATIDMAGFDGCLFLTSSGTILATGTAVVKVQQGNLADGSDGADLLNTGQSFADTDDNVAVAVDVRRPRERYLRLLIVRATANSDWSPIWALRYRGRAKPPVNAGATFKIEQHFGPAEGAA